MIHRIPSVNAIYRGMVPRTAGAEAVGEGENKLAAGGRQVDVSAVADEQLSPELTFKVADLLRQRRSRNVQPLRGPTEVQLLGNRDEVAQLSEFHAIDRTAHW